MHCVLTCYAYECPFSGLAVVKTDLHDAQLRVCFVPADILVHDQPLQLQVLCSCFAQLLANECAAGIGLLDNAFVEFQRL